MRLFGCVNTAPDLLGLYLIKTFKVSSSDIMFVHSDGTLLQRSTKKYYILLGVQAVKGNLDRINSKKYEGTTGIVCDNTMELHSIKGIIPLDYKEAIDIHVDAFDLAPIGKKTFNEPDRTVYIQQEDYTDKIVEKVESFKGLLTQFMTFIYTNPSATHQTPLKNLACSWLASAENESELQVKLDTLVREIKLSEPKQKRFMELLTTETALLYKTAIAETLNMDTDSKEFYDIITKYEVSAYEVRYIMAINKQSNTET